MLVIENDKPNLYKMDYDFFKVKFSKKDNDVTVSIDKNKVKGAKEDEIHHWKKVETKNEVDPLFKFPHYLYKSEKKDAPKNFK